MTVEQLIEELQGYPPTTEVRLAHQPQWPFEYSISAVVGVDETADDEEEFEMPTVVYIVEGRQIGYLPEKAGSEIGW